MVKNGDNDNFQHPPSQSSPSGFSAAALIPSNLICREKQIVGIWPSGPGALE